MEDKNSEKNRTVAWQPHGERSDGELPKKVKAAGWRGTRESWHWKPPFKRGVARKETPNQKTNYIVLCKRELSISPAIRPLAIKRISLYTPEERHLRQTWLLACIDGMCPGLRRGEEGRGQQGGLWAPGERAVPQEPLPCPLAQILHTPPPDTHTEEPGASEEGNRRLPP